MTPEILAELSHRVECGIEYLNTNFENWKTNLVDSNGELREINLHSSNLHILTHLTGIDYNLAFVSQENYQQEILPRFISIGLSLPETEYQLYPYLNEIWRHKLTMSILENPPERVDEKENELFTGE